jgi:hypothetical protein
VLLDVTAAGGAGRDRLTDRAKDAHGQRSRPFGGVQVGDGIGRHIGSAQHGVEKSVTHEGRGRSGSVAAQPASRTPASATAASAMAAPQPSHRRPERSEGFRQSAGKLPRNGWRASSSKMKLPLL